jgi:hypothetical protein
MRSLTLERSALPSRLGFTQKVLKASTTGSQIDEKFSRLIGVVLCDCAWSERRSPLDSTAGTQFSKAQPTWPTLRVCTRANLVYFARETVSGG